MLFPLSDAKDIKRAQNRFFARLTADSEEVPNAVFGHPGWHGRLTAHWRPAEGMYAIFDEIESAHPRYWNVFGVEDPRTTRRLSITCEINPPLAGQDRQCAGVFASDDMDRPDDSEHLYVLHSGNLGGGRPGIGPHAFMAWYQGPRETLGWRDGKHTEWLLVGRLEDGSFVSDVAQFVHNIAAFKKLAEELGTPSETNEGQVAPLTLPPGPLDVLRPSKSRKEQDRLRDYFFGARQTATCSICGQDFPVGFLVAAHIKRRHMCSDDELRDWRNVIPMCTFGCDVLFERGYIGVDSNGIIRTRRKGAITPELVTTPQLETYRQQLVERPCRSWDESREPFFAWHRQDHQIDNG